MKKLFIISFIALIFSFQNVFCQSDASFTIDENTIIKDKSGKRVEFSKLMDLLNSGEWTIDPVKNKEGKFEYMKLRKTSEKEKEMFKSMPMDGVGSDLIGKTAPNFEVVDINGNEISSKELKGKIIVLNFWFTTCKPCIDEIPSLNKVFETYKDNPDVIFASITFNHKSSVNSFKKKHPIKYPVVSDAGETCKLFNLTGYPTNVIIDKNGNYLE
ncbi:TlpA family protein disulfide reductase, partial [Psychroserpens sp.]